MAYCPSSPARLRRSITAAVGRSSSARMLSSCSSTASPSRPTCLCSPTNHAGSFRCSMHRSQSLRRSSSTSASAAASTSRLDAKAKAKANDLRSLLMQMILPSKHNLYRRHKFQPQPSRFYVMNDGSQSDLAS